MPYTQVLEVRSGTMPALLMSEHRFSHPISDERERAEHAAIATQITQYPNLVKYHWNLIKPGKLSAIIDVLHTDYNATLLHFVTAVCDGLITFRLCATFPPVDIPRDTTDFATELATFIAINPQVISSWAQHLLSLQGVTDIPLATQRTTIREHLFTYVHTTPTLGYP